MLHYTLRVARRGDNAGRTIQQVCQGEVVPRIGEHLIVEDLALENPHLDEYICPATVTMVEHQQLAATPRSRASREQQVTLWGTTVYAREDG